MNEFFEKHRIELSSTENEGNSSAVERWNGRMKAKVSEYFTANNTNQYLDALDEVIEICNNTKHSSIKCFLQKRATQKMRKSVVKSLQNSVRGKSGKCLTWKRRFGSDLKEEKF